MYFFWPQVEISFAYFAGLILFSKMQIFFLPLFFEVQYSKGRYMQIYWEFFFKTVIYWEKI